MTTERIRFLSPKQTYELTNLSPRTQGRLAAEGRFPAPVRLFEGSRRIGFVESEVQAWLEARLAAARRSPAGAEPDHAEPSTAESRGGPPGGKNGRGGRGPDPPAGRRPQQQAQPPPRRRPGSKIPI